MEEAARMRVLLKKAQEGDPEAHAAVALYCFTKYEGRIKRLYALDPAVAYEDLLATFYEGIHKAVPLADGRGDDFYHIGQRGVWAVQSEIRAINSRMRQRSLLSVHTSEGVNGDYIPIEERESDRTEDDFRDVLINSIDAHRIVRVITTASLRDRQREVVDLILSGTVGDPSEKGFNKALAERMDVSPQRVSQLMKELAEVAAAA